jgi:S1/P1 Nuclease
LLRLNPDHKTWIKGIPSASRDKIAFTRAAGWPDDIKSKANYTNDHDLSAPGATLNVGYSDHLQHRYWHFIDLPFSTDNTPLVQPDKPNAETQIKVFRDTLASPSASDEVKSYDLVWLLHLVGDVHQPLHATSRFSQQSPKGDRGGNDVMLCAKPCRDELHAFWDDLLGNGKSATAAVKAAQKLPRAPARSADQQDVRAWIEESFEIAKKSAYAPPIGQGNGPFKLNNAYKRSADAIGVKRVTIAGARLARLLNDVLRDGAMSARPVPAGAGKAVFGGAHAR